MNKYKKEIDSHEIFQSHLISKIDYVQNNLNINVIDEKLYLSFNLGYRSKC